MTTSLKPYVKPSVRAAGSLARTTAGVVVSPEPV